MSASADPFDAAFDAALAEAVREGFVTIRDGVVTLTEEGVKALAEMDKGEAPQ